MRAKSLQFCPTLCKPMDCSPPGSSVHEILQQEYWSGLSFPPPGDLLDPGIIPSSLMSPASAGGLFTTSTTSIYIHTADSLYCTAEINLTLYPREFPGPSVIRRHSKEMAIDEPRGRASADTGHASALMLDFQPPVLWDINVCCVSAAQSWYFGPAAQRVSDS